MARVLGRRTTRLGLIGCLSAVALLSVLSAGSADVDDASQIVMLANSLVTGTYGWPVRPQVQRLAVYHDYALAQLGVPLAAPAPGTAPPAAAPGPAASGASPAANAVMTSAPFAQGPGSFVAFKAHRNWVVLFSKSGTYSQKDLIAAGVPPDVASGLIYFMKPPPSQPPSPA